MSLILRFMLPALFKTIDCHLLCILSFIFLRECVDKVKLLTL